MVDVIAISSKYVIVGELPQDPAIESSKSGWPPKDPETAGVDGPSRFLDIRRGFSGHYDPWVRCLPLGLPHALKLMSFASAALSNIGV